MIDVILWVLAGYGVAGLVSDLLAAVTRWRYRRRLRQRWLRQMDAWRGPVPLSPPSVEIKEGGWPPKFGGTDMGDVGSDT